MDTERNDDKVLYTPMSMAMDFSVLSLDEALAMLHFHRPVVHVHPNAVNDALGVLALEHFPVLVAADPRIANVYEWFVVWNGQAVGSCGA